MSNIVPAPHKIITTHQSDDDVLRRYFKGELEREQMSEKLQDVADQMLHCSSLMRQHASRLKVCPMLQNTLNVSQATSYRIYARTERLFGETSVKNQPLWLDIELGNIEEDIRDARKLKDYRSVAALRKIKADLIVKTMGSGDAQLYEKIQPPEFVIGFFPRTMKVSLPKDKELSKLIQEKLQQIAEDAEIVE